MTVADLVAALEPLSSFDAEFVAVIDDDPRTGFCNNFDPPQVPGLWLVSDKAWRLRPAICAYDGARRRRRRVRRRSR